MTVATIRRALAAHPWPEGGEVRVRVALHAGEAAIVDGDYVRVPVRDAARICSAGHGGQILLSRVTRDLVQETSPPRATLRDLGEYRLKDLAGPHRLYELTHPDVERGSPSAHA